MNSAVAWSVTDAAGTKVPLDPGVLASSANLAIAGHLALQPPFSFVGRQPLVVDGRPYRGKITVSSDGKHLQVIDTVGLEAYLKGVVPSEMPSNWPPDALKAQAVAARSYALANLTKGRAFDLYGDTRSQVYGGIDAEFPTASDAVDATKGQVVLYNGKVADTLFFSTSGGRTTSSLEATGDAVPLPRLGGRPLRHAVALPRLGPGAVRRYEAREGDEGRGPVSDLQTTTGPSGRVETVKLVSADDSQVTMTGAQMRSDLGAALDVVHLRAPLVAAVGEDDDLRRRASRSPDSRAAPPR